VVKFVISRMDDQAGRCFDSKTDAIRDGMADVKEINLKSPNLNPFTCIYSVKVGFMSHAISVKFDLDQAARQFCRIDRGVNLFQQMLNRAK